MSQLYQKLQSYRTFSEDGMSRSLFLFNYVAVAQALDENLLAPENAGDYVQPSLERWLDSIGVHTCILLLVLADLGILVAQLILGHRTGGLIHLALIILSILLVEVLLRLVVVGFHRFFTDLWCVSTLAGAI